MNYTRHLEAPDQFHFWAAIATLAGALRGKVWIDMGYWSWKPNFFIIFVAPPGIATKSTTIGVGQELLRSVEGIHFGPDSATWQGITDAFLEATEIFKLPSGEDYRSSSITIAASELGTFLDPNNREMVDVLVDLWDGRDVPWKRRTKHEGASEIQNPWLNFIGATTPGWLAENFPEYAIRGGFTSRTVFVFASSKRHFVAYPSRVITQDDAREKHLLAADLQRISLLAGPFTLTEEAFEWGTQWYEEHWAKRPANLGDDDRLSGYLARKQTHVHKLAMIMSAARSDDMRITPEDLQLALIALESIEKEMLTVFDRVSDDPRVKNAQAILTVVKAHPKGIGKKTLWRKMISHMSQWEFDNALAGCVNAGLILQKDEPGKIDITLLPEIKKEDLH
jgi:hypothetical protein